MSDIVEPPDLMGLMLVASDVLVGVSVEESDVFTESTSQNWSEYDVGETK